MLSSGPQSAAPLDLAVVTCKICGNNLVQSAEVGAGVCGLLAVGRGRGVSQTGGK